MFFVKPIISKNRELDGNKNYYYIAQFKKKEYIRKEGKYLSLYREKDDHHSILKGRFIFYSKAEIDKFPKYMRKGGEYGHDQIKIRTKHNFVPKDLDPFKERAKYNDYIKQAKLYKKLFNMDIKYV